MPLTGPRPLRSTDRLASTTSITILSSPASLSDDTQISYPHQSSLSSGTPVNEPLDEAHMAEDASPAELVRRQWQNQEVSLPKEEDVAFQKMYTDPYDDYRLSLGPDDSASQQMVFPSPQAHIPLSTATNTNNQHQHLKNKPSYLGGLSYIDEDGDYHKSKWDRPASAMLNPYENGLEMQGLVKGAAGMGSDPYQQHMKFEDEYGSSPQILPDPSRESGGISRRSKVYSLLLFPTGLDRLLGLFGVDTGKEPLQQAIERKRRGLGGQKWPVAAWGLALGESVLFHALRTLLIG